MYAFCVCLCRWRQHEATLLRCCLCIRLCIPGHSVAALPQLQGQVCGLPGPRHVVPQHFPQWWVDAVWVWESMGRSVCFSLPICCTSFALSATASRAGLFHYRNWKTLKPQLPMTWTSNNSWALGYRFCLVAVTMLSSLRSGLCWLSNINIVKTIKDPPICTRRSREWSIKRAHETDTGWDPTLLSSSPELLLLCICFLSITSQSKRRLSFLIFFYFLEGKK